MKAAASIGRSVNIHLVITYSKLSTETHSMNGIYRPFEANKASLFLLHDNKVQDVFNAERNALVFNAR